MDQTDKWGKEPQVRYLRKVFSHVETAQRVLFNHIQLSSLDPRLRRMREGALNLFEQAWLTSTRKGISLSEAELGELYVHCLARLLRSRGIDVPASAMSANQRIETVLREVK